MIRETKTEERDEILTAFHRECENPSAEQIIEWTTRYPQFADDIIDHAALLKDAFAHVDDLVEEPDEEMLARARSRMLDALYRAEIAAGRKEETAGRAQSFHEIVTSRGTDIRSLASDLDIGRSVLADLMNGAITPPIGGRLVAALTKALEITSVIFNGALRLSTEAPRLGHAKATEAPTIIRRPYEDVIRDSSMSPERKRYWLGED